SRAVRPVGKAGIVPSETDRPYALNDRIPAGKWLNLVQKYPETVLSAGEKYEPSRAVRPVGKAGIVPSETDRPYALNDRIPAGKW
ncbi:hypothetical protein CP988_17700, partial [Enterococcus faecium]